MYFSEKCSASKITGDKSLKRLLLSPAIMASGISTKFLPENPKELCDRLKKILHEKQPGNISNIIIEEIVCNI